MRLFFVWQLLTILSSLLVVSDGQGSGIVNDQSLSLKYQKALASQSCELMIQLAEENQFVLKDLALLRAHLLCKADEKKSTPPNLNETEILQRSPYLKSLTLELQSLNANRSNNPASIAKNFLEKAQYSDRLKEKLDFVQKALEIKNLPFELKTEIESYRLQIAPRYNLKPTPSDYYKVAADSLSARDFVRARKLLKAIYSEKNRSLNEKIQARKLYRNSFKIEQKKDHFLKESKALTHWYKGTKSKDWKLLHDLYLQWARGAWTQGQVALAKQILNEAEKSLNSKWPLDEIEFIRGRMDEEIGAWEQALAHYSKALQLSSGSTPLHDRLLFLQAWMFRRLERYNEAIPAFEKLKAKTQDPFDLNRYSYWLGKTLQQAGKKNEANAEFEFLKTQDLIGFYGLLAYRELKQDLPALKSLKNKKLSQTSDKDSPLLDPESQKIIEALTMAKENEILEKFLNYKTNKNYAKIPLAYLKSYASAGIYLPLFSQIGSMDGETRNNLLKDNPELIFPRKESELITKYANKFSVRPELIFAIIRQESAFNPLARSAADAFGLMQLLPAVAKQQETKTGIHLQHFEDLYRPEINIPVGAAFLSDLQKRYRGQFVLIAASYNANDKAIENWLRTRLKEDPIEFIEDIPYDETRSYVKLVLRNFIFYSRLNNPDQAMAFPSWCLEDLQSFKSSTK